MKAADDENWARLEQFTRLRHGRNDALVLSRATSIADDLDITGDDAIAFMGDYFEVFGIDSGDFDFHRYFHGEGIHLLAPLLMLLRSYRQSQHRRPLTLGMLEKALRRGAWKTDELE